MSTINHEEPYGLRKFNLLSTLLSIVNENNENEAYFVLAKYLLEHFNELDHMSIYELSDTCYVSRSSVQRFIKYIGFNNFNELKFNARQTIHHGQAYIDYADHSNFNQYFLSTMKEMILDITNMLALQNMSDFVEKVHNSKRIIILTADIGSSSARQFQQGMAYVGKLVRLVTDSTSNLSLLETLTPDDLLITVSVTGNFALSILNDIQNLSAQKALITINHSDKFFTIYDTIIYLSQKFESFDYITNGFQNVYTRHGSGYFFDTLFHLYVQKYVKESVEI